MYDLKSQSLHASMFHIWTLELDRNMSRCGRRVLARVQAKDAMMFAMNAHN